MTVENQILQTIQERQIVTTGELVEFFDKDRTTIYRWLKKLEESGKIEQVKRGTYKLKKPSLWERMLGLMWALLGLVIVFGIPVFAFIYLFSSGNNNNDSSNKNSSQNTKYGNTKVISNVASPEQTLKNVDLNETIDVKYRGRLRLHSDYFTGGKTSDSTIEEIYYDPKQRYMVVSIEGTYYHYCGIPWQQRHNFYVSSNTYSHYKNYIYQKFDCRQGHVPDYPGSAKYVDQSSILGDYKNGYNNDYDGEDGYRYYEEEQYYDYDDYSDYEYQYDYDDYYYNDCGHRFC